MTRSATSTRRSRRDIVDRRRLRRRSSRRWSALSFAAVPLYNWFCRTTGFAGTTQVSRIAPEHDARPHQSPMRFDSNVDAGPAVEIRAGAERDQGAASAKSSTVHYKVINEAARDDHGAGVLQRHAADRRRLLQQDQLLLLHRADA